MPSDLMPTVIFIQPDESRREVSAAEGTSVMIAAIANDVDGILGECGGNAACATCHVYVQASFLERLSPPQPLEDGMLEATASERLPNSRLSCQIMISSAIEGAIFFCPETQN